MAEKSAQLTLGDTKLDLPIYSGTIGPDVIDVGQLTGNGVFTYDPGFVSTAACESKITYIDGGKGVLLHRGYPIIVHALVPYYATAITGCNTKWRLP